MKVLIGLIDAQQVNEEAVTFSYYFRVIIVIRERKNQKFWPIFSQLKKKKPHDTVFAFILRRYCHIFSFIS